MQGATRASKKFLGILGLVVPLATAGLWFIYSLLARGEARDFLTPLILAVVPLSFVYFRRPIDRVLLPLQPLLRPIPRLLRYILAIALPLVLAYIIAAKTYSGYGVPRLVSLIGLVLGYVLIRNPEVRQ